MTVADVAGPFKKNFVAGCRVALEGAPVDSRKQAPLVYYGHPGSKYPFDFVSVGRVTSNQNFATMSKTNRSRENTLTVDITISIFRPGDGDDLEEQAGDRFYELLGLIEEHFRTVDTTVGGLVRHCFCTSHESDGSTDQEILASGRLIEGVATFTAPHRITS